MTLLKNIFVLFVATFVPIIRGGGVNLNAGSGLGIGQSGTSPNQPSTGKPGQTFPPPQNTRCPTTTQPLGPPTSTNDKYGAVACFTPSPADRYQYFEDPYLIPDCDSYTYPWYGYIFFDRCRDARAFCEYMTTKCAAVVCDGNRDYYCTLDPPRCADCTNIKCVRNVPQNGQFPTDWTELGLYNGVFYFSYCWQAIKYCIFQGYFCDFNTRDIGVYYNRLPAYCQDCRS